MFFVFVVRSCGGVPAAILRFGAFWPSEGLVFLKDALLSQARPYLEVRSSLRAAWCQSPPSLPLRAAAARGASPRAHGATSPAGPPVRPPPGFGLRRPWQFSRYGVEGLSGPCVTIAGEFASLTPPK